jgi:hypothetical protein
MIRPAGAALLAWILAFVAPVATSGCGGNVCQEADEHVADCLGAEDDDDDEEEVADEDCTEDIQSEAECILDAECGEINSGEVYERCAAGG